MSESYINQITIDYLINKEQYNKIIKKEENFKDKDIHKKDIKFYKKRIIHLTKELLINENEKECENDQQENIEKVNKIISNDVNQCFHQYIHSCIEYFKIKDRCDILQEDYLNYQEVDVDISFNNLENINNKEELNKLFMRSVNIKKPSLDHFIKKTSQKKENIVPMQKKINLRNPDLKWKGINNELNKETNKNKDKDINKTISKKKNIINNYDETNETL